MTNSPDDWAIVAPRYETPVVLINRRDRIVLIFSAYGRTINGSTNAIADK